MNPGTAARRRNITPVYVDWRPKNGRQQTLFDMTVSSESPETLALLGRLVADRAANPARHVAKICFFLGAGADLSSGGISFSELKRQAIEQFVKRPIFDITRPEDIEARFEQLFAQ